VKFCIHDHVDCSCNGIDEMNIHSQVALFYKLKGSNFRHVGCEIKSKQGVSFGIIFSRNGISLVLIYFFGTVVESHITSDVAIVFEVGLYGFGWNLSSVNVERHKIDIIVFEIERFFPIVPFRASLSTQAITSLFGSCPKHILS